MWELNLNNCGNEVLKHNFYFFFFFFFLIPGSSNYLDVGHDCKEIDYRMSKSTWMALLVESHERTCYNNKSFQPNPFSLSFISPVSITDWLSEYPPTKLQYLLMDDGFEGLVKTPTLALSTSIDFGDLILTKFYICCRSMITLLWSVLYFTNVCYDQCCIYCH